MIVVSSKRKSAVARAKIVEGTGKVTINNKIPGNFHYIDKLRLEEPLRIAEAVLENANYDIAVEVKGGGEKGQVEAARLAIAKAISEFAKSEKLTKTFSEYDRNLLVADVRRKETYKPGDSKARKKRQSSKR